MTIGINLAVSMRGSVVDLLNQMIGPNPCVHKNFLKRKDRNHMQYNKLILEFRNRIISLGQKPELTEVFVQETSKLSLSSILEWQSRPIWISTWLLS